MYFNQKTHICDKMTTTMTQVKKEFKTEMFELKIDVMVFGIPQPFVGRVVVTQDVLTSIAKKSHINDDGVILEWNSTKIAPFVERMLTIPSFYSIKSVTIVDKWYA